MNYASTSNIREDIKFYNLGDKTFETDFSTLLNTVECCRGLEGRKDEISTSLTKLLIFLVHFLVNVLFLGSLFSECAIFGLEI